jgi:chemotaxis signal transduction protein
LSAETPAPLALAPASEAPPTARACVVVLGGRPFAVDVTDAREVVVLDTTTPVPGAPTLVIGVMNLRGNVLPVVEARPLLGLPVRAATDRALVLADGERRAAVLIEAVLGLTTLDSVRPPAAETPGSFTVGELNADTGGHATLLDGRAVLAALRRAWEPASGGA